jgi:hypothetical protein
MELKFGKVGGLWVCELAADSSQPLGEMKLFIVVALVVYCFMLSPIYSFQN